PTAARSAPLSAAETSAPCGRRKPGRQPGLHRRWSFQEHLDLVDEAPAPIFSGLERGDDGMFGGDEVLACMPILRIVAAPHVSASSAQAKMNPGVAHGETFLATFAAGGDGLDRAEVRALLTSS